MSTPKLGKGSKAAVEGSGSGSGSGTGGAGPAPMDSSSSDSVKAKSPQPKYRLLLKSPLKGGAGVEVELGAWEPLRALRRLARRRFGARNIRLLSGADELRDWDCPIRELPIIPGDVINVLPKLKSGNDRSSRSLRIDSLSDDSEDEAVARKEIRGIFAVVGRVVKPAVDRRLAARSARRRDAQAELARLEAKAALAARPDRLAEAAAANAKVQAALSRHRSASTGRKPPIRIPDDAGIASTSSEGEGDEATQLEVLPNPDACARCSRPLRPGERQPCRCGLAFCTRHKHPLSGHACSFDHAAHDRATLMRHPRNS